MANVIPGFWNLVFTDGHRLIAFLRIIQVNKNLSLADTGWPWRGQMFLADSEGEVGFWRNFCLSNKNCSKTGYWNLNQRIICVWYHIEILYRTPERKEIFVIGFAMAKWIRGCLDFLLDSNQSGLTPINRNSRKAKPKSVVRNLNWRMVCKIKDPPRLAGLLWLTNHFNQSE